MARKTRRIIAIKNKKEKIPVLKMTPIEFRNMRKTFLLREETKNNELKHNKWEEIRKLIESNNQPTEEKRAKENELFKIILKCDDLLIKINDELTNIEKIEEKEKQQENKSSESKTETIEIININN